MKFALAGAHDGLKVLCGNGKLLASHQYTMGE
jgi:hypothetical protein